MSNHKPHVHIRSSCKFTGCNRKVKARGLCGIHYQPVEECLAAKRSDLAEEWNKERNGALTPYDLLPGSGKKVWWKCRNCGHEWATKVEHRTKSNSGCNVCSSQRGAQLRQKTLISKQGSFADLYPEIAREWHPKRNGTLTPADVTFRSGKKVWWECPRGHYWQAPVSRRTGQRSNCPHCRPQTSKLEIRLYTELKAIFNSAKWRDKVGGVECDVFIPAHNVAVELDGYPWHDGAEKRDAEKTKILRKKGIYLLHIRHVLLKPLSNDDLQFTSRSSPRKIVINALKAILKNVHVDAETRTRIDDYIAGREFWNQAEYEAIEDLFPGPPSGKSLAERYPSLVREWVYEKNLPLTPERITAGVNKKVWWRCKKGHEWETVVSQRTGSGTGCPYCARKVASSAHNLLIKRPALAKLWHPTKNEAGPETFTPSSNKIAWWVCEKGHEYHQSIKVRAALKISSCPYCSSHRINKDNNLAAIRPDLVSFWDQKMNGTLTPYDVAPRSSNVVWWKCEKGHSWQRSIRHMNRPFKIKQPCRMCRSNKTSQKLIKGAPRLNPESPSTRRAV